MTSSTHPQCLVGGSSHGAPPSQFAINKHTVETGNGAHQTIHPDSYQASPGMCCRAHKTCNLAGRGQPTSSPVRSSRRARSWWPVCILQRVGGICASFQARGVERAIDAGSKRLFAYTAQLPVGARSVKGSGVGNAVTMTCQQQIVAKRATHNRGSQARSMNALIVRTRLREINACEHTKKAQKHEEMNSRGIERAAGGQENRGLNSGIDGTKHVAEHQTRLHLRSCLHRVHLTQFTTSDTYA